MSYYDDMYKKREQLIEQIKNLKTQLIRLPEGELHIQKDRKQTKWMVSYKTQKGNTVRKYLPKSQFQQAQLLALSTLYKARLKDREKELKAIERCLQVYDPAYHGYPDQISSEEQKVLSNEHLYALLQPYLTRNQIYIHNWLNEPYESNSDYYPDQLRFLVNESFYVRSKSEVFIAEVLIKSGLPFRYEVLSTNAQTSSQKWYVFH